MPTTTSSRVAPLATIFALNDSFVHAALGRPGTAGLPFANTLADELAFFAMHDSYHVGQMAYIRKGLGQPGLAG